MDYTVNIVNLDISSWEPVHKYNAVNYFYRDIMGLSNSICVQIRIHKWFDSHYSAIVAAIIDKYFPDHYDVEIIASESTGILFRNGLLRFFNKSIEPSLVVDETALPVKRISVTEPNELIYYLEYEYFSKDCLPNFSEQVKYYIIENFNELLLNTTVHSGADSIYVSGQFFPNKHKISIMFVDVGIGIVESVNNFLLKNRNGSLSSVDAIKWALRLGNTTKTNIVGGLGLYQVLQLVTKNKGTIEILSGNGLCTYSIDGVNKYQMEHAFHGVSICVTLNTDDSNKYIMSSEKGK